MAKDEQVLPVPVEQTEDMADISHEEEVEEEVVAIHPSQREASTGHHLSQERHGLFTGRFSTRACATAMLLAAAACMLFFFDVLRVVVPVRTKQLTPKEIVDKAEAEIRGQLLKAKLRKLTPQTDHLSSMPPSGRDVDAVNCQIDTSQAVFRIIRAANGIEAAAKVCPSDRPFGVLTVQEQKDCAGAILQAIYSFTITTAMIAAAVSDCGHKLNGQAACASTVTAFVGNAEACAHAGLIAEKFCNLKDIPNKIDVAKINKLNTYYSQAAQFVQDNPQAKKLPATLPPVAETEYDGGALAACFAQAGLGTTFAERMGTVIQDSLHHCAPEMQGDFHKRKACAVDMTGLMASLGLSITFLSSLGETCKAIMGGHNFAAACTAGISGAVGTFSVILSAGISLNEACGPPDADDHKQGTFSVVAQ